MHGTKRDICAPARLGIRRPFTSFGQSRQILMFKSAPLIFFIFFAFILSVACALPAQSPAAPANPSQSDSPATPPDTPNAPSATLFPHPDSSRFLILGQTNIIFQAHAPFHSPYDGPNSLQGRGEYKTSLLGTLYLGAQVFRNPKASTDFIIDVESSGGRGISQALGLAGFTNLDVVRNPNLGSKPYIARIQLHQIIGLGGGLEDAVRTPFSLATSVPTRRIDLRFGKMSLPDFLDLNSVGTDSHLQFMNWTVDNNGAWDYAADTRGYTYAGIAEIDDKLWSARYAPRPHAHGGQRYRRRLEHSPRAW